MPVTGNTAVQASSQALRSNASGTTSDHGGHIRHAGSGCLSSLRFAWPKLVPARGVYGQDAQTLTSSSDSCEKPERFVVSGAARSLGANGGQTIGTLRQMVSQPGVPRVRAGSDLAFDPEPSQRSRTGRLRRSALNQRCPLGAKPSRQVLLREHAHGYRARCCRSVPNGWGEISGKKD